MGTEHDNDYSMYLDCGEEGYKAVEFLEVADPLIAGLQDGLQDGWRDGRTLTGWEEPWTVRIKLPRTSRKRFIKMLMSYGLQRNSAVALASFFHRLGLSYAAALYYSSLLDLYRTRSKRARQDF